VTEAVERETRNLRERLAHDASIRAEMVDRIRDLEGDWFRVYGLGFRV